MSFLKELDKYFTETTTFPETPTDLRVVYSNEIALNWNGIGSVSFQQFARTITQVLYRQDIFDYFEQNLYEGYVATMLWGKRGHVGDGGSQALNRCMSVSEEEIQRFLSNVKSFLQEGKIKEAFNYLSEDGHIKGVGISYFTKILYFLGKDCPGLKPLIYDTKLKRVHWALIKEMDTDNSFCEVKSFSISSKSVNHKKFSPADYYIDYLNKISVLVNKYKDRRLMHDTPVTERYGRMEMILFSDEIQNKAKRYLFGAEEQVQDVESRSDSSKQYASSTKQTDGKISLLREKYPRNSVTTGKRIKEGPKAEVTANLSDGTILAAGFQNDYAFCGIYSENGIFNNPYPDIFNKNVKVGYYKRFENYQDALSQFEDILEKDNK